MTAEALSPGDHVHVTLAGTVDQDGRYRIDYAGELRTATGSQFPVYATSWYEPTAPCVVAVKRALPAEPESMIIAMVEMHGPCLLRLADLGDPFGDTGARLRWVVSGTNVQIEECQILDGWTVVDPATFRGGAR